MFHRVLLGLLVAVGIATAQVTPPSPLTSHLSKPGMLTYALGEKATQTLGDWHPGKSLWLIAWEREAHERFILVDLAERYVTINERREDLPSKQVDMPADLRPFFGPSDTKFGRWDENHIIVGVLADIAVTLAGVGGEREAEIAERAVALTQRIVVGYAAQKNSYLSVGGVLKNDALVQYLGSTGRVRKAAMIVRMLGYDVPRVMALPGWTLPAGVTADTCVRLLDFHLTQLTAQGVPPDDPKGDHLPRSQYLCPFQLRLLAAACERTLELPWPEHVRTKAEAVRDDCDVWVRRSFRRNEWGAIVGCTYDVKYPDHENTFDVEGAKDGMGVALHLAGADAEFDAFLKQAKANELKKTPALAAKFALE